MAHRHNCLKGKGPKLEWHNSKGIDMNSATTCEAIKNNFTYHKPTPEKTGNYELIRAEAKQLAHHLAGMCPPSRELSLAITKLEECIMWANASIACNS